MDINLLAHIKNKTPKALGKKHTFFFILLLISTFNFQLSTHAQETPFPTDHLQLWLRADSVETTDEKVSRWYDLSPNNYVIQQTTASYMPTINESAINDNPALQFNGSSTYLTGGDILDLGNSSWTWFVVGKVNVNQWNRPYLSKTRYGSGDNNNRYSLGSSNLIFMPGPSGTEYNVGYSGSNPTNYWHSLIWENNRVYLNNTIYINNNLKASASFSNNNMNSVNSFLIGGYGNSTGTSPNSNFYLNGQIAEIIAFNTVNDSLRYSVNEYIVNKYFPDQNTQVSLGLDIHVPYGFCDTAITTAYNPNFISYQWSTGETDSIIHVNRSGRYTVTVTNSFGVTSTDDINVYFPEISKMQDTTICAGDTIYWDTGLDVDNYTFQWFNGDTPITTRSLQSLDTPPPLKALQPLQPLRALDTLPTLRSLQALKALSSSSILPIYEAGSYSCLVTDSLGCTFQTDTVHVAIDDYPISTSFRRDGIHSVSDTSLCSGNTLGIASNVNETTSYTWSTGATSPRITLTESGDYSLATTNSRGCRAVNSIHVNILGEAPEINFNIDNLCFKDSTSFVGNAYSEQGIESYLWIIDDTDSIASDNFNYEFATAGVHDIRTIVTSNNSCHTDSSFNINIKGIPYPNFTYTPVCTGIPMNFIGSSNIPDGTSIESYTWLINDSIIGTNEDLTFGTDNAGIVPLKYSISLSNGCSSDTTIEVSALSEYSEPRFVSPAYPTNGMLVSSDSIIFLWNCDYDILYYNLITSSSTDFSNADTIPCSANSITITSENFSDTTYWKVTAYNHCLISFESEAYFFRKTTGDNDFIATNPNLQLWLRADSVELTNGKVSRWYDLGPNNYVIQQTTASYMPTKNESEINNNPALMFNGSSTYLTGGDILDLGNSSWTWFIVGKDSQRSWNRPYLAKTLYGTANGRYSLASSYFVFVPGPSTTEYNIGYYSDNLNPANRWHTLTWENNRNNLKNTFYLNNNNMASASFSNNNMNNSSSFLIGAYNGRDGAYPMQNYYFNGQIAEIIVFNTVDDNLRYSVNEYLVNKYFPDQNTQVSLGLDIHIPYGLCDTAITTAYNPDFISYQWSTGETDSIIHINRSGRYTVTVTNSFGVTSTDDINVYFPEISQMQDTTICAGDTIYWDTGLDADIYTFQWFNGDTPITPRSLQSLDTPPPLNALQPLRALDTLPPLRSLLALKTQSSPSLLPISEAGSYSCLITDSLGCTFQTDTVHVAIDDYPISTSFRRDGIHSVSDTSLCSGNTLGIASNVDETTSYTWSTGATSPLITLTESGNYSLTTTNYRGCHTVNSIHVNILGEAPEINFNIDNLCFKDSTSFVGNAYSEQGIESYLWIIDATDSITEQSFNHRFASTGNHDIRTIVTSNNTCITDSSFNISIKEIPYPDFTYTPVCTGIPMNFIGNSTIPDGTSIESYTWLINDSIIGTNENLTFSTDDASIVSLTYMLFLSNGCSSDTTIEVSAHSEYSEPRFVSPAYPTNGMLVSSDSIIFSWNYDYDILYYNLITSSSADFSNADTIPCLANSISLPTENYSDTTYWKVSSYNHCLLSFESEPYFFRRAAGDIAVSTNQNLQLWLRADSVGLTNGKVSRWYDLSPNNYVIQQSTASYMPTINESAINNNPALQFNGSSTYLTGGDILDLGNSSWTWFVIGRVNVNQWSRPYLSKTRYGSGDNNNRYSLGSSNLIFMPGPSGTEYNVGYSSSNPANYWHSLTWENNRVNLNNTIYINNNLKASTSFSNNNMNSVNSFLIGGYGNASGTSPNSNFYLNGQIAEIIAFNTVNDSLRYSVNEYLVYKYFPDQNTQVSLGLDIHVPYGFCDTAITTAYNPDFISYLWSTGETDSVIHVNRSGRYTVTVTNSFGVTSTDDINVYFPEHFQLQDTTICAGDTIYWNLKMRQDEYSFQWYKDGGQLDNVSNQIEISEAGAYTCLITDSLGCSFQTDTMHLAIDNYPISAGFENSDTTLCYGNRLHLSSNYEETAIAIWNDGTTELEHYLTQPGTYTITTTNTRGCTATNSINVNIQGRVPTPNFTTEGHCQNAEVTTTNLSTSEIGEISLYRWYANDSLIGTTENISHSFDKYGTQSLKLYLETSDHCFNDTTIPIYIYPQPKPDFSPKHFCQNAPTEINARTTIAEGDIINHLWNLGDGSIAGESITNTFESYGIKTITLSAESEEGCIGTKDIEVNVLQAEMPATEISGVCLGYETTFINKTQFNNINPQTAWEWNFGDDTETSPNKNTAHTYDTTGTYNVSLTVSFANHCSTTTDTTITIHELPEATITANDGCVGTETTLDAEIISVDNIATYKWQIDSIFESSERRPTFVSDTTGTFAITLDVLTEFSCPAQATDSIIIHRKPDVAFTQSRDWGGSPLFVEFENTSEGATSYHWGFGNEGESSQVNPYYIFTEPGTYEVSLIGTNEFGCSSKYISSAITVVEPIVDIMLMDLKANEENGFAKISLIIVNLGTLPVEDLVLELKYNDHTFRESIDYIAQGEVRPYTFGTQMPVPQSNTIKSTICVEALVPDVEDHNDMNLANNSLCITDAENLSVGIPYPIPAREQITCDIYTKIPTDLDISIFNIFGKLVKHEQISQHKGYLKYVVNVTDLAGGMYFIRVNSKDESITHKFEIR